MVKRKISDFDWLVSHLHEISRIGQELEDGNMTTDYRNYTALKLIVLHYTAEVFSKVARHANQRSLGFDGAVYVDLFAGTGLVKLKNTKDIVAGSAPCAIKNKHGFDYSVLVEINRDNYTCLKDRVSRIIQQDKFDIICGDANDVITEVIGKIKARYNNPIVLAFVDPEGLEIKFQTLKKLSDAFPSCDFLINVNTLGVSRVAGKIKRGIHNVVNSLEGYLDEDAMKTLWQLANGETPEERYASQIKDILGKSIGDTIPIYDHGNKIAYHLLGYTRRTGRGSGYSDAFSALKERIGRTDRDDVRRALDKVHNRTYSLDNF